MNKVATALIRKLAQARNLDEALAAVDVLVKEHKFIWRPVGDRENNYGSINIGSDPGHAFVERVWEELEDVVPFKLVKINIDDFDDTTKTTRIWGDGKKGQATPLDRILILERAHDIAGRKPKQNGLQRGQMRAATR